MPATSASSTRAACVALAMGCAGCTTSCRTSKVNAAGTSQANARWLASGSGGSERRSRHQPISVSSSTGSSTAATATNCEPILARSAGALANASGSATALTPPRTRNSTPRLQPSGITWRGRGATVCARDSTAAARTGFVLLTPLHLAPTLGLGPDSGAMIMSAHSSSLDAKDEGWSGRFSEPVADFVLRYTASVGFDRRLAFADIEGSLAHGAMLARIGVLSAPDLADIERGLAQIRGEIERSEFVWQLALEDVHLNIERRLIELVGDAGKRLHTGRS